MASADAHAARAHRWLLRQQEAVDSLLHDADLAAEWHLLRLQAKALETEAAALANLLALSVPAKSEEKLQTWHTLYSL